MTRGLFGQKDPSQRRIPDPPPYNNAHGKRHSPRTQASVHDRLVPVFPFGAIPRFFEAAIRLLALRRQPVTVRLAPTLNNAANAPCILRPLAYTLGASVKAPKESRARSSLVADYKLQLPRSPLAAPN